MMFREGSVLQTSDGARCVVKLITDKDYVLDFSVKCDNSDLELVSKTLVESSYKMIGLPISKIEFTREEIDMLYIALSVHKNYIETGDISISSDTASKIGKKTKTLSYEQMEHLVSMNKLMTKLLN